MTMSRYWAPAAWIAGGWQESVVLEVDAQGRWSHIAAGVPAPADAERLAGPVLPGLVDAHSHAFQRAFAGLAERRDGTDDDFWSWRDRMYQVANAVTPESLRAIAAHLYVELLRGGCSTGRTARPTTTRSHCRWHSPTLPPTLASASRCCPCSTNAPASPRRRCARTSAASTPGRATSGD
jgi:cytosine/adenosine deaminase-related metal-dependent hydrolase